MLKKRTLISLVFSVPIAMGTFIMPCCMSANAAELGHFSPAIPRARDFFIPAEPGAYFAQYNTYYSANTYKNGKGDKVNSVTVGPVTADVDIDIDSYMIIPAFMYSSDFEILGARYGFFIMQPLGDMALDAKITTNIDRGISSDDSSFGMGDTVIQPLWLDWTLDPRNEVEFSYAMALPVGKYDYGDSDNVGMGYFTHQLQFGAAHYFDDHHMTALTGALTYELNHNKEGADIRPGDRLSVNMGLDHMEKLSEAWFGNAALIGYGQWQVTEDNGSDATRKDIKDQVYGIGIEAGLTYLPWEGQASLKWAHEFEAEDRFEGDYIQLTVGIPF